MNSKSLNATSFKIAIVDIGFSLLTKDGVVLINECTIHDCYKNTQQTFHIKCGKKTLESICHKNQGQLQYNKQHFHQIPISYGSINHSDFCALLRQVLSQFDCILVKGDQKKSVLKNIVQKNTLCVLDFSQFQCPSIDSLFRLYQNSNAPIKQSSCLFHNSSFQYCTAYKTQMLHTWLQTRGIEVYRLYRSWMRSRNE